MRITSASIVATPESVSGHGTGIPGPLAPALTDQLAVVGDDNVALAVPATWTLPKQVALNVPEPVLPVNCVTVHEKFVQLSCSDPL